MNQLEINKQISEMGVAIEKGEYSFPEFSSLKSKKARKEYSLKAHSVVLRLLKEWNRDDSKED